MTVTIKILVETGFVGGEHTNEFQMDKAEWVEED